MRLTRTRRWVRPHHLRFEALAEAPARLSPRGHAGHEGGGAPYTGTAVCPRSGEPESLDACVHCEHFVNVLPAPHHATAVVRCLACDDDPLAGPMASVDRFFTIVPEVSLVTARMISWLNSASMLVVAQGSDVLGVVYANALQHGYGTVAERMVEEPWSILPSATLGTAVEALHELALPALLVVDPEGEVQGAVSVSHLRRLGVPPELLRR